MEAALRMGLALEFRSATYTTGACIKTHKATDYVLSTGDACQFSIVFGSATYSKYPSQRLVSLVPLSTKVHVLYM